MKFIPSFDAALRSCLWTFGIMIAFGGCARFSSDVGPEADYMKRRLTQAQGGLRVSVAGLSDQETKKALGTSLKDEQILAVWLEVENHDQDAAYYFFERHVDPHYYTPSEAAYMSRVRLGSTIKKFLPPILHFIVWPLAPFDNHITAAQNRRMEEVFETHAFKHGWIASGVKKEGFIFLPYELGLKEMMIDLEGYRDGSHLQNEERIVKKFDFIIEIPGIRQDYLEKPFETFYPEEQFKAIDQESDLLSYLEKLPCCTTDKKGRRSGDPLNLVVIGEKEDVLTSFTVSKWDETEMIYLGSILKTIASFSFKKSYRYSPVSPLYYLGRSQDIAFQKARKTINQRMHARLWYAPVRYRGKSVWIGSVSRDIGVRFTHKTWNLMTHKIDPDINEAALYTLNDLAEAEQVASYGIAKGIPPSRPDQPATNLTGDPYYTDGTRVILELSKVRHHGVPERLAG